ncbi:MAG: ATP/GTP-binding protein, partial [Alphaproteobacteria bacterium]
VLYDGAHKRLIVSNIDGAPNKADGNGYLSLLSLDGKVTAAKWASGMDAPKGMAIAGKHLYVSDITQLRIVDVETGKLVKSVPMEGSVFLNDITASPEGDVYISDMMTNTIYRYHDGKPEVWLRDEKLNSPNGVLFAGDHLIVGTWGKGMKKDFTTETPGGLITVNLKTKTITPVAHAESFGNIDGVVKAGDTIIVTDYIAGVVWRCPSGKAPEKAATLKPGSADLGTDGAKLFIPMMNEGEVVALPAK